MRLAYLIATYKYESEFEWLLNAIYDPNDVFLVHIDKKTPDHIYENFKTIVGDRPNVRFMPRVPVVWGCWGLCQVELNAMVMLLDWNVEWRYFINLSGQDYPIKPKDFIRSELRKDPEINYITLDSIDDDPPRLRRHFKRRTHWFCFQFRNKFVRTPIPLLRPRDIRIAYRGAFWHLVTRDFCRWVVEDELAARCCAKLKHMKIPDEFLMQLLMVNSPFKDTIACDNKRVVVWTGKPHPEVLTVDDYPMLKNSGAFYARKFDTSIDMQILEALSRHIHAAPAQLRERLGVSEIAS
jgi:hypothetical protein